MQIVHFLVPEDTYLRLIEGKESLRALLMQLHTTRECHYWRYIVAEAPEFMDSRENFIVP